jgi:hypothetical protein
MFKMNMISQEVKSIGEEDKAEERDMAARVERKLQCGPNKEANKARMEDRYYLPISVRN